MDTPEKVSGNIDFSQKTKLIYQFSSVGFVSLIIFGIVNLSQGQTSSGIAELVFGLAILGNVVYLRWQKSVEFATNGVLFLMLGVLAFLLVDGGIDKSGLFWFYTYPALAFFLKGRKKGLYWILVLLLMIATVTVMSMLALVEIPFSEVIVRQLLVSLVAVSFLIYFYQQVNEKKEKLLDIDRADHEEQAKILVEKDQVIEETLKSIEGQNQNLSNTKMAMLNVLEDAKELQNKLESQADDLRKFQLATQSSYEHIIITDSKGVILYANPGAARNTGYSIEEMIGKTTALWGGQMDKEYYKEMWQILVVKKQPFVNEITNKRKNGDKYIAQLKVSPILDDQGEIKFFVGLENDVTTERKLAANLREEKEGVEIKVKERTKELQAEQGKLQASINSLNVGFVMTDTQFKVVNINSTAKRILCIDDFKAILHAPGNIGSNCSLEDIEENLKGVVDIRENIKKCLNEKNIINIDDISFNNRFLHFFLSPIALYREKLDIIGVVILVEDVTEAKILARSKDEFFSIASHELRTPLTAIRGNTALMKDYYFDKIEDKDLKVMIGDIHESSVRLIQIVNDFLDTSRLEQRRIEFHNEDFDLPTVIEEVSKELEPNLATSELYLKLKPSNVPVPLVIADRDRVKQILINLIGNAIKFTKEGGITIALTPTGSVVKISITDTGQGLTEVSKNLLFRKFQQAEDNILTRDATRGTGLGLYISKLLVEGMGGKIYLENSQEKKGSTFSFELQAVAKTEVIAPKEEVKKKRVFKSKAKKGKKKVAKK
mgnify:CR=1 FL=1